MYVIVWIPIKTILISILIIFVKVHSQDSCTFGFYENPKLLPKVPSEVIWLEKKVTIDTPTSQISICFHVDLMNMYAEPTFLFDINTVLGGGFTRTTVFVFGANQTIVVPLSLPFNIWIHICFVIGVHVGFYYEGNAYFEDNVTGFGNLLFQKDILFAFGLSDQLFSQDRLLTPKMRFTLPEVFMKKISLEEAQSFLTCGSQNRPKQEYSETKWALRSTHSPDILLISQPELKYDPDVPQTNNSTNVPCEVIRGAADFPIFAEILDDILSPPKSPKQKRGRKINEKNRGPNFEDIFHSVIHGGIGEPTEKRNQIDMNTLQTHSSLNIMGVFTINVTSTSDICAPINKTKLILIPSSFSFDRQSQICKDLGGSLLDYSEEQFPRIQKLTERLGLFSIYVYIQPKSDDSCLVLWYANSPTPSLFNTDCGQFQDGLLLCDVPVTTSVKMKYFWDDDHWPPPRDRIFTDNLFFIVGGERENMFVSRFGDVITYSRNKLYLNCSRGENYEAVVTGAEIFGRHIFREVGNYDAGPLPPVLLTLCKDEQFTCTFGACIPLTKRCDGREDCEDGSDERCEILLNDNSQQNKPPYKRTPLSMTLHFVMVENVLADENLVKARLITETLWHDPRVNFSQLSEYQGNNELMKGTPNWRPIFTLPNVNFRNFLDYRRGKLSHYFTYAIKLENVSAGVNAGVEGYIYNAGSSAGIGLKEEFIADFYCPMDLLLFPFDIHVCSIQISIKNPRTFLVYFDLDKLKEISKEQTITLFDVSELRMQVLKYREGEPISLGFRFLLKRRYGSFILTNVIPCLLIGVVGTTTYLFTRDNFQDRIMVTLSCLIVIASLFSQLSSSQPKSASSKAIEIIFFYYMCKLSLIFMTHALSAMIHKKEPNVTFDLYNKVNYHSPFKSRKTSPSVYPYLGKPELKKKAKFCSSKAVNTGSISVSLATDIIFIIGFVFFILLSRNQIYYSFYEQ